MLELIGVGLRSVMTVGCGVLVMKLSDGHRWKCSRQGGMEFKHVGRCGVYCEIHTRTSMKDEKKKQPPVFQIEEVMISRMNVVNGRREIGTARRQRRREEASKQFGKQARSRSK
jgi:hypothetical protein